MIPHNRYMSKIIAEELAANLDKFVESLKFQPHQAMTLAEVFPVCNLTLLARQGLCV
jgi:hypothetical protein